jgi:hypothetical protein
MEILQGNSLCSDLYLKLKYYVYHFMFSLLFSYKTRVQEGGTSPAQREGCHQWKQELLKEKE